MNLMKLFIISAILMIFPSLSADVKNLAQEIKTPGKTPTGLVFDGQSLWIGDHRDGFIYTLNPSDGRIMKKIQAPGYRTMGLAFDGKNLWSVDIGENAIYKIDPSSGNILNFFDSPVQRPTGLAWDGKQLWLADDAKDRISTIDPEDGTDLRSIPAPSTAPTGMTWDGKYLWAADRLEDRIYMLNPLDGEIINMIKTKGKHPWGIAWDKGTLFVADYQDDAIMEMKIDDTMGIWKDDEKVLNLDLKVDARAIGQCDVKNVTIYIAMPRHADNQEIIGDAGFYPEKYETVTDKWGQKMAKFRFENLKSGDAVSAGMKLRAKMHHIRYFIMPHKVKNLSDIPKDIKKLFLSDDEKYLITDPYIQKIVSDVAGEEKNPYWIMRRLYNYVISNMEYEMAGGWNAAPTVLKRKTGSCSEYTFALISLLRAAGIPARYVGSIVVRKDDASWDEFFHRWVEAYLPGYGWIPIDANKGDDPKPSKRASGFGELDTGLLITTWSGGNSEFLNWNYNYDASFEFSGKCKVKVEAIAEWEP
jgi:transglutaminase-like putative cysteine protease/sugar lactone lactonase YvrE